MDIYYLGHSSFRIKGKNAAVVTDPYSSSIFKFRYPKVETDIVTISHQHEDHNNLGAFSSSPFTADLPGEYEVKGVSIFGFPSYHDDKKGAERGANTIFLIEIDGLRVCHVGDLGETPSDKVLEEILGSDILMVPVGGKAVLTPKEASDLVSKIEPLIILPMHYKTAETDEYLDGFSELNEFLSQMGAEEAEKLDKLSISKDKLPTETKVVVLERKS